MHPSVLAVSLNAAHRFSKPLAQSIHILTGLGVEGDAHCGDTVKHRSRVARNPDQPNLRQVHLIAQELFAELESKGFTVKPGDLGENITTQGIPLITLPVGTELRIGPSVRLRLTGLRSPCAQIENFQAGLLAAMLERLPDGTILRKTGVMSVVLDGGVVRPGDSIEVLLPPEPHAKMECI